MKTAYLIDGPFNGQRMTFEKELPFEIRTYEFFEIGPPDRDERGRVAHGASGRLAPTKFEHVYMRVGIENMPRLPPQCLTTLQTIDEFYTYFDRKLL